MQLVVTGLRRLFHRAPPSSDELREQALALLARHYPRDVQVLNFCRRYHHEISTHYEAWVKGPPALRYASANEQFAYLDQLLLLALVFDQEFNDAALSNTWQRARLHSASEVLSAGLDQAYSQMGSGEYAQAATGLEALLTELARFRDPDAPRLRAIALSTLADTWLARGDPRQAIVLASQALPALESHANREPLAVGLHVLAEAHRALGENEQAARYAEHSAQAWRRAGRPDLAERPDIVTRMHRQALPALRRRRVL